MASVRSDGGALSFLYGTAVGRMLLKPLTARALSKLGGRFMDSPLSQKLIASFVRRNGIDLSDYEQADYSCFNDFFTRRIRAEKRPFEQRTDYLASPCDGRLSAFRIDENSLFAIKHSRYSVDDLLGHDPEAARFKGGLCLVFRLCVDDYHRYHYLDSGVKGENHFIGGVLHTVRPIALEHTDVFVQNCREYCLMQTDHCGCVAQIEVGALLVGKIKNHQEAGHFERGAEKGLFLYGGSTVVLLFEPGRVELDEKLFEDSAAGLERRVRCGQAIGRVNNQ